jgi:hypothetical protein
MYVYCSYTEVVLVEINAVLFRNDNTCITVKLVSPFNNVAAPEDVGMAVTCAVK